MISVCLVLDANQNSISNFNLSQIQIQKSISREDKCILEEQLRSRYSHRFCGLSYKCAFE